MKQGKKLKRKNWNGKNQFVFLVKGVDIYDAYASRFDDYEGVSDFDDSLITKLTCINRDGTQIADLLAIKTTSNQIQLGWLASQTDMLSNDWEVIEYDK